MAKLNVKLIVEFVEYPENYGCDTIHELKEAMLDAIKNKELDTLMPDLMEPDNFKISAELTEIKE